MPKPSVPLDRAVILFDRPVIGGDGLPLSGFLPAEISIRGVVDGMGPTCVVAREVVQRLCRIGGRPTWRHLEKAWAEITDGARNKVRAGRFETGLHEKTTLSWIRLRPNDLPE
jgi:hypothetical protein